MDARTRHSAFLLLQRIAEEPLTLFRWVNHTFVRALVLSGLPVLVPKFEEEPLTLFKWVTSSWVVFKWVVFKWVTSMQRLSHDIGSRRVLVVMPGLGFAST